VTKKDAEVLKRLKRTAEENKDKASLRLIVEIERRSKRYRLGYDDGSGIEDTIYDTKTKKPIAVVSWGCGCCCVARPGDAENGQMIVDALNAYTKKRNKA
jgi:hypothetical protein